MSSAHRLQVMSKSIKRDDDKRSWAIEWMDPFQGPSRRRGKLHVKREVSKVLVIHKLHDSEAERMATNVAEFIIRSGAEVFSERQFHSEVKLVSRGSLPSDLQLIVSIGGDGTLLHAARLYSEGNCPTLPPCVIFGMGSLGFLGNFKASKWPEVLTHVMSPAEAKFITVRSRLKCTINDDDKKSIHVLNECALISRWEGKLGKFILRIDGEMVTVIEGDGIVISTATGSTGYSMSLGGPIVSPSVPCTILTPIAPSSLSFRPIIVSESSTVEVICQVKTSDVIADGRHLSTISTGDKVSIVASPSPMIVVNSKPLDHDWYEGINSKLKWNARGATQK